LGKTVESTLNTGLKATWRCYRFAFRVNSVGAHFCSIDKLRIKTVNFIGGRGGVEPNSLLLRPIFGLLYQPRMMIYDERGAIVGLTGETEALGENIPQCRFAHHKCHMTRPGLEPGPPPWEVGV
jgi:hypothetical protein